MDDKIIFIVGVGRSGTTLLQSMLNAHSKIVFPPETHFFRTYIGGSIREKLNENDLVKKIEEDEYIARLNIDIKGVLAPYEKGEKKVDLVSIYLNLLYAYSDKLNKKNIIGDKDPRNIELIPLIKKHFPNAIIIHIMRDPRDILVSKMKANWSKNRNFYLHVLVYLIQIQKGRKEGPVFFGEKYYEIYYEELIQKPKELLYNVCELLDVLFEKNMLDFGKSAKSIVTKKEMQWKKESLGPLLTENHGKWKKALTAWQIAVLEEVCSKEMKDLGYEKSNAYSKLNIIQRCVLKLLVIPYKFSLLLFKFIKFKSN